jgi:hypothetical protein
MTARKKPIVAHTLVQEWVLPAAATLGSAVRARGILLELRARLPNATKKSLDIVGAILALRMVEGSEAEFGAVCAIITSGMESIESLPVIPREIQDILSISATERHRWLKDGRLQSAGTRTVKLRGRAKKITFHVFDPRHVEEVLDKDWVSAWREDDALTASENRRRAAWNRRLTLAEKSCTKTMPTPESSPENSDRLRLKGFAEFERDGLLH